MRCTLIVKLVVIYNNAQNNEIFIIIARVNKKNANIYLYKNILLHQH